MIINWRFSGYQSSQGLDYIYSFNPCYGFDYLSCEKSAVSKSSKQYGKPYHFDKLETKGHRKLNKTLKAQHQLTFWTMNFHEFNTDFILSNWHLFFSFCVYIKFDFLCSIEIGVQVERIIFFASLFSITFFFIWLITIKNYPKLIKDSF